MKIKIKIIDGGRRPEYARKGDAYARGGITVPSGRRRQIPLGFSIELPEDYELQVRPMSGLSKKGIDVALGTGDSNFRDGYQATVINNSQNDYEVARGDRICQIAIRKAPSVSFEEVSCLSERERGANGWGSSGR